MTEVVRPAADRHALVRARLAKVLVERRGQRRMQVENRLAAVGRFGELLFHRQRKAVLDLLERNAVLRPLGPGKRGLDLRELELEHVGEHRVGRGLGAVHALRLGIGLNQRDALGRAAGVAQISERIVVDRKKAAGGAILR